MRELFILTIPAIKNYTRGKVTSELAKLGGNFHRVRYGNNYVPK